MLLSIHIAAGGLAIVLGAVALLVRFRNEVVTGVGGKQIIVDDPSGNPVERFQPTLTEATLGGRS